MKIELCTDEQLEKYIAELNGLDIEEVKKMKLEDVLSQIEGAKEARDLCERIVSEAINDGLKKANIFWRS